MSTENFEKALKEINRFNSQDPRQKIVDGIAHPQEAYSKSLVPSGKRLEFGVAHSPVT